MAASISLKHGKVGSAFFKTTAKYIVEGAKDYIKEAMPATSPIYEDAKREISEISSKLKTTTTTINQHVRRLKSQSGMRSALNWYMNKSDEFGGGDSTDNLTFDIDGADSSISDIQIGEAEKNANKIASSVVESNKHLLEGQANLTADIHTAIDNQTAVITAGFDKVSSTLNELLKVVTKNTATIIETTAALKDKESPASNIFGDKFNISDYKAMVKQNLQSNPLIGMMMSYMPLLTSGQMGPKELVSIGMGMALDEFAPNIKDRLNKLDKVVNNAILDSIIRLGEDTSNPLSGILGYRGHREEKSGGRSSLSLKAVPFDSLAHEAITGAIPGYLRKILAQLGGGDYVYDYRSRSFRSQGAIAKDFHRMSAHRGTLADASSGLRNSIGNDAYGSAMYDIMMADLSGSSDASGKIRSFGNVGGFEKYMSELLSANGYKVTPADLKRLKAMGNNISNGNYGNEIRRNAVKHTINRNKQMDQYISEADAYGVDLRGLETSIERDIKTIMEDSGMISSASKKSSGSKGGVDYTNYALYRIHQILRNGINVYQTGASNSKKKPYSYGNLEKPQGSRMVTEPNNDNEAANPAYEYTNELAENAKNGLLDMAQKGLSSINSSMGNIGGYLKHKLFGEGYEYTNEKGETVKVATNDKGGIFGFLGNQLHDMFGGVKEKAGSWLKTVGGYFDYGNDGDGSSKRKQIMTSAVGAFAGAGILGGPLGLLVGGLAGSAMGASSVGSKINEFLFGKGGKDANGNKKKMGIFTKLTNSIIDPIRFQFEKTFSHIGNVLKKNILGPLSDIGYVIKERIVNTTKSAFGKIFKVITAPFKAIGNALLGIAKAPIALLGGAARAGASAYSGVAGAGLNGIADILAIGGKDENGNRLLSSVHQRRKARNEEIKANSKKYDWTEWKAAEDEKREARRTALQEAMAENSEVVTNDVHELAERGSKEGSIYTHDKGVQDRLDIIIEALTGKKPTKGTDGGIKAATSGNDNGISSSNNVTQAVGVAATLATEGNLTHEDENTFNDVQNEADKEKPSKSKIRSLLNKMFRSQEEDKTEAEEKKTTFWDFIKSTLGGIGGMIIGHLPEIAGIAGIITLLNTDIPTIVAKVKGIVTFFENVFGATKEAAGWFFDKFFKGFSADETWKNIIHNFGTAIDTIIHGDGDDNPNNDGTNAATSLLGFRVKNNTDLANPGAAMYHLDKDATGADIVDQGKTGAKFNYQLGSALKTSIATGSGKYASTALKKGTSRLAKGLIYSGAGLGTQFVTTEGLKKLGVSDQKAEAIGHAAGSGVTAGAYVIDTAKSLKGAATKPILESLKKIFDKIGVELPRQSSTFSKLAKPLKEFLDDLWDRTVGVFTDSLADEISSKIMAVTGKNIAAEYSAVLTLGLTVVASAAVGAISGYCGTEYLFGILPGDADKLMNTISSALRAVFAACECIPVAGLLFTAFDLLDEFVFKSLLKDSNGRGMSLKSGLAALFYTSLMGEEALKNKREAFDEERKYYNDRYDTDLDYDTFNDFMNNDGIISTLMRKKLTKQSDGSYNYEDPRDTVIGKIQNTATNTYNSLSKTQQTAVKTYNNFILDSALMMTPFGSTAVAAKNAYKGINWIKSKVNGESGGGGVGGPIGGKVTADEYYRSQNTVAAAADYKTGMPSSVFNKVYHSGYDFKGNPLGVLSVITSPYGYRKVGSYMESHNGVDMIPADGSAVAKVASPISGTVSFVRRNVPNSVTGLDVKDPEQQTGNMVRITGKDGTVREFMHLKSGTIPPYIKEGATVKNGSILGTMGATGRADGAHLHYTVKENGIPVDPMSYLLKQKYKTTSDTAGETLDYGQYDDSSYDGSEDNRGILAKLMDFLSSVGSKLLNVITGGLTGSTSDSSFSDNNTSNVHNVDEFLKMVANEIGTKEEPMGSNNVKYNTWYYGKEVSGDQYMWCMVFVQWCFDHAGLTLPYKTALCKGLWEYYQTNMPTKCHAKNPKPGDIVILGRGTNGGHTGIVEKVNGVDYTTIEGNSGDQVKRVNRKVSDSNLIGFITAVDFGSLSATLSGNYGDGAEGLWKYFKQLGYSDNAIAGILGCWTEESSCKTARMEGDYLQAFKDAGGYDALVNDRNAMDAYTNKLFSMYAAKGISINRGGYKANDGHYYPGIGVAQWTGERARKLLEFAKSKGLDWKSPEAQLAFFDQEIQNGYAGVKPKLQAASTPEEATQIFESGYEGSTYGLSKRQQNAKALSMKYGSGGGTGRSHSGNGGRIGGPLSGKMVEKLPNGKTITEYQGPGIGGPSSIGTTNYMSRSKSSTSASSNRYARSTPGVYSSSASRTAPSTSMNIPSSGKGGTNDDVVILMARAIEELVKITNNTASSSDLLDSLNNKDFVDKGLRDSFEALNKVSKSKKSKNTLPTVSANAALRMANP